MKIRLFILCLLLASKIEAQELSRKDFERVSILSINDTMILNLASYGKPIYVYKDSNQIKFKCGVRNSIIEYPINYGLLSGIDRGEFGGGLYYRPNNRNSDSFIVNNNNKPFLKEGQCDLFIKPTSPICKKLEGSVKVISDNVKSIFTFKKELYVMCGLMHLSTSLGTLYKLNYDTSGIQYTEFLNLGEAPFVHQVYNGSIYLLLDTKFCKLKSDFSYEVISSNMIWNSLNPNSLEFGDSNTVFIGVQGGFVIMSLNNGQYEFYKVK